MSLPLRRNNHVLNNTSENLTALRANPVRKLLVSVLTLNFLFF